MDQILRGIFESNHPEKFKKLLFLKVADAQKDITDKNVVRNVLQECLCHIQEEESLNSAMAKLVFERWGLRNPTECYKQVDKLFELVSRTKSMDVRTIYGDAKSCIWLAEYILKVLSKQEESNESEKKTDEEKPVTIEDRAYLYNFRSSMTNKLAELLVVCEDPVTYRLLCQIVIQNWGNLSRFYNPSEICNRALDMLATISIQANDYPLPSEPKKIGNEHPNFELFRTEIDQATTISGLVGKMLQTYKGQFEVVLNKVFSLMSSEITSPKLGLAAVLQHFATSVVEDAMVVVSKDTRIKENNLMLVLNRMISWLAWPAKIATDVWIVELMKALMCSGRSSVVYGTIEVQIDEVIKHLYCSSSQQQAFAVLASMLLCYQHNHAVFHKVIYQIVIFIKSLRLSDDRFSKDLAQVAADLVYTMMFHFGGHDKIYSEAMETLKEFNKPSEQNMSRWLSEYANFRTQQDNTSQYVLQPVILPEKPLTQKTGLKNLGNTCYINSVMQALFMLKSFRTEILQRKCDLSSQPISSSLQKLFAYLLGTKRLAINPKEFVHISRPPWFNEGTQQDCSEFLKYLLDKLEDEGRQSPPSASSLHNYFTGECRIQTRCFHCGTVTSRTEPFNDLSLSFPVSEHPYFHDDLSKEPPTLKGGELLRSQNSGYRGADKERNIGATSQEGSSTWTTEAPSREGVLPGATSSSQTTTSSDTPLLLKELIGTSLNSEVLSGANQYKCDSCQMLCDAERQLFLTKMPKYLVLTLKRFTYNAKLKTRSKIMTEVNCPLKLHIPETVWPLGVQDESGAPSVPSCSKQEEGWSRIPTSSNMPLTDIVSRISDCPATIQEGKETCSSAMEWSSTCTSGTQTIEETAEHETSVDPARLSYCSQCSSNSRKGGGMDPPQQSSQEQMVTPQGKEKQRSRFVPFLLSAVIVHSGVSSDSGHYYCFCREGGGNPISKNESNVTKKCLIESETGLPTVEGACQTAQCRCVASASCRENTVGLKHENGLSATDSSCSDAFMALHVRKRSSDDIGQVTLPVQWILFNDSQTTFSDMTSITGLTSRVPNDTPYVLVYENVGIEPDTSLKEVSCRDDLQEHLISLLKTDDRLYCQELVRGSTITSPLSRRSQKRDDGDEDKGGSSGSCGGALGPGLSTNGGRFIF